MPPRFTARIAGMRRAFLAWLGLAALACSPAPLLPRRMPPGWSQPVEVRLEPGFRAAVLPVQGSYAQWDAARRRLEAEVRREGLSPSGPTFARYLNDSAQVPEEALRWELGVPVGPSDPVRPP